MGTITFHKNYDDYVFKGIINRNNNKIFVDLWYRFCISDFIVERINNEWSIDFIGTYNLFKPIILSDYPQFKKDYPEYQINNN